jgi:hypothetical protein
MQHDVDDLSRLSYVRSSKGDLISPRPVEPLRDRTAHCLCAGAKGFEIATAGGRLIPSGGHVAFC